MSANNIPVELVRETLHVARKLNISRMEAARRMVRVLKAGSVVDGLVGLYAAVIRHETTEQWRNLPNYEGGLSNHIGVHPNDSEGECPAWRN